jgi:hypothetical protein
MVLLLLILAAIWIFAIAGVLAVCVGAREGDEMLAAELDAQRRRELASGVVKVDGPGLFGARDLRDATISVG